MTPEEAYWHACSNTPIDEAPAPVPLLPQFKEHVDLATDRTIFVFSDNVIVFGDNQEITRWFHHRDAQHFRDWLTLQYLEARRLVGVIDNLAGASGDPTPDP